MDFITNDKAYIHATIVIAVIILGINRVKPSGILAEILEAVPKITAIIKII